MKTINLESMEPKINIGILNMESWRDSQRVHELPEITSEIMYLQTDIFLDTKIISFITFSKVKNYFTRILS